MTTKTGGSMVWAGTSPLGVVETAQNLEDVMFHDPPRGKSAMYTKRPSSIIISFIGSIDLGATALAG